MKIRTCLGLFSLTLAACSGQPATSTGALSADPTARSFGIASYAVEGDTVRMLDQAGVELGTVALRDAADSRFIDVELTDGSTKQIEIYRPMSDGRFVAPISRTDLTTAALGDAALADVLHAHDITLRLNTAPRAVSTVGTDTVASTTVACVGSLTGQPTGYNHNEAGCTDPNSQGLCDWTSHSPDGCARPANLHAGCSNPSQLPPTLIQDQTANLYDGSTFATGSLCNANRTSACAAYYGGQASDWINNSSCHFNSETTQYDLACYVRTTENQWQASCPPSTCTAPNYDAVPRQASCYQPGSCFLYNQGTVGCTPYHSG